MPEKNDLLKERIQQDNISLRDAEKLMNNFDRTKFESALVNKPAPDNYAKDKKIIDECSRTGEPTFCLRAKDLISWCGLKEYLQAAKENGCKDEFVLEVSKIFDRFAEWRSNNSDKLKLPD